MKNKLAKVLSFVFAPILILALALSGGFSALRRDAQDLTKQDTKEIHIAPYNWQEALAYGFDNSEDGIYNVAEMQRVLINLSDDGEGEQSTYSAHTTRTTIQDNEAIPDNILRAELIDGQIELVIRANNNDHYIAASTDAEFVLGEDLANSMSVAVKDSKIYTKSSRTAGTMATTYDGATITTELARIAYVVKGNLIFKNTAYSSRTNTGRAIYVHNTQQLKPIELLGRIIYPTSFPTVTIQDSTFTGYSVTENDVDLDENQRPVHPENRYGSVIYNNGGRVIIKHSASEATEAISQPHFYDCHAEVGGVIYNANVEASDGVIFGDVTIEAGLFDGNTSTVGGGGVISNGGQLTINSAVFESNSSSSYGGVIANREGGVLTINNGEFYDNSSRTSGGVIYSRGTATIVDCDIYNNTANNGGAISIAGGEFTIRGGVIGDDEASSVATSSSYSNYASAAGGAIYVQGDALLTIRHAYIYHNYATTNGGAIYSASSNSEIVINDDTDNVRIRYNAAASNGGAIYSSGTLSITSDDAQEDTVEISNNTAANGGGVYSAGTLTISGGNIRANLATNSGGGVYSDGTLTLEQNSDGSGASIIFNTATRYGGGVFAKGTCNMSNGLIARNQADYGGGICVYYGTLNATGGDIGYKQSKPILILPNTASSAGGGIYLYHGATANLQGVRVVNNTAQWGGGIATDSYSNNNLLIDRNSANQETVISNNYATNGSGGGVYVEDGSFEVGKATISGNSASVHGGGIYTTTDVLLDWATMQNNSAEQNGGAIYVYNSELTIYSYCTIGDSGLQQGDSSNYAEGNGGAIYADRSTVTLDGANIYCNYAEGNGGAIYAFNGTNIEVTDYHASISGNGCAGYGGAIYTTSGVCTLDGSISNNYSGSDGGGIYSTTTTTIRGSVSNNVANGNGGGLYITKSVTLFTGASIAGNRATGSGGGLFLTSAVLEMYDGCIGLYGAQSSATESSYSNYAGESGGGIYAINRSTLTFYGGAVSYNCANYGGGIYSTRDVIISPYDETYFVICYNIARTNGGGIYSAGSLYFYGYERTGTYMYNCYVCGNTAKGSGGGIFNTGLLSIYGAVIYENHADSYGGGIRSNGDAVLYYGRLHSNTATYGAGISVVTNTFTIEEGLFGFTKRTEVSQYNEASRFGGSIHCVSNGTVIINGGTFRGDKAPTGGIIYSGANIIINGDYVNMGTPSEYAICYIDATSQSSTLTFNDSPILSSGGSAQIYLDKSRYITLGTELEESYSVYKQGARSIKEGDDSRAYIANVDNTDGDYTTAEVRAMLESACSHISVANLSETGYCLDPGVQKANFVTILSAYILTFSLSGYTSYASLSSTTLQMPYGTVPEITTVRHGAKVDNNGNTIYSSVTVTSAMYVLDDNGNSVHPSVTIAVNSASSPYAIEWYFSTGSGNTISIANWSTPVTTSMSIVAPITYLTYGVDFDYNGGIPDSSNATGKSLSGLPAKFTLKKGTNVPVIQTNQLSLDKNSYYYLTFTYVADGTTQFNVDLYPDSLPQRTLTATTTVQHYIWDFYVGNVSDITRCYLRFFNDITRPNPCNITISEIKLYRYSSEPVRGKSVTYNQIFGPLPTSVRAGYAFDGWYTEREGGTKVTRSTVFMNGWVTKLYAHWTARTYSVYQYTGVNNLVDPVSMSYSYYRTDDDAGSYYMCISYNPSDGGVFELEPTYESDPHADTEMTAYLEANKQYSMHLRITDAGDNVLRYGTVKVYYGINRSYSEANSIVFTGDDAHTFTVSTGGLYNFRFDNDTTTNDYSANNGWNTVTVYVRDFWVTPAESDITYSGTNAKYDTRISLPTNLNDSDRTFVNWVDGGLYGNIERDADGNKYFVVGAGGGVVSSHWLLRDNITFNYHLPSGAEESETIWNFGSYSTPLATGTHVDTGIYLDYSKDFSIYLNIENIENSGRHLLIGNYGGNNNLSIELTEDLHARVYFNEGEVDVVSSETINFWYGCSIRFNYSGTTGRWSLHVFNDEDVLVTYTRMSGVYTGLIGEVAEKPLCVGAADWRSEESPFTSVYVHGLSITIPKVAATKPVASHPYQVHSGWRTGSTSGTWISTNAQFANLPAQSIIYAQWYDKTYRVNYGMPGGDDVFPSGKNQSTGIYLDYSRSFEIEIVFVVQSSNRRTFLIGNYGGGNHYCFNLEVTADKKMRVYFEKDGVSWEKISTQTIDIGYPNRFAFVYYSSGQWRLQRQDEQYTTYLSGYYTGLLGKKAEKPLCYGGVDWRTDANPFGPVDIYGGYDGYGLFVTMKYVQGESYYLPTPTRLRSMTSSEYRTFNYWETDVSWCETYEEYESHYRKFYTSEDVERTAYYDHSMDLVSAWTEQVKVVVLGVSYDKDTYTWFNNCLPSSTPTKTGYTFVGYSIKNYHNDSTNSADLGGAYISGRSVYVGSQDIKIEYIWRGNIYTITLDPNLSSSDLEYEGPTFLYFMYNSGYSFTASVFDTTKIVAPRSTSYIFCGYYLGNTLYINHKGDFTSNMTKTAFTSDTTLKAKWETAKTSMIDDGGNQLALRFTNIDNVSVDNATITYYYHIGGPEIYIQMFGAYPSHVMTAKCGMYIKVEYSSRDNIYCQLKVGGSTKNFNSRFWVDSNQEILFEWAGAWSGDNAYTYTPIWYYYGTITIHIYASAKGNGNAAISSASISDGKGQASTMSNNVMIVDRPMLPSQSVSIAPSEVSNTQNVELASNGDITGLVPDSIEEQAEHAETAWFDDKHRKLSSLGVEIVTADGDIDGLIV